MLLERFRQWIQEMRTRDNCFSEHKDEDEKCFGLFGGDSWSENHCYECMDCPHLSLCEYNRFTNLKRTLNQFQ